MKKSFLVGLIFLSFTAQGGLKESLRKHSLNYFGPKVTNELFGAPPIKAKTFVIPPIPEDASQDLNPVNNKVTPFEKLTDQDKRHYFIGYIQELSYTTRGIRIDDEGITNWLNVLEQGGSQEGIYRAMVLDRTYQNLESFKESLTPEVVLFVQNFGAKFLKQQFKKESLVSLNIYSIKRIITEKALEVVDLYLANPNHLYQWYAIFSSEMAKMLYNPNRVRAMESQEFHYKWAQQVPLQHIKAEVIIKLHKALNQLNIKKDD